MRILTLLLFFLGAGCGGGKFTGQGSSGAHDLAPVQSRNANPFESPRGIVNPIFGDGTLQSPDSDLKSGDGTTSAELQKRCWFAVSGTYFGSPTHNSSFPSPAGGGDIRSGASFDTVGGVFLSARDEPYISGQDTPEGGITLADKQTFDSIAIAPGMRVEIRNARGQTIVDREGPYLAVSTDNYNGRWAKSLNNATNRLRQRSDLPSWFNNLLPTTHSGYNRIELTSAKWVKVTVIEGAECDSSW